MHFERFEEELSQGYYYGVQAQLLQEVRSPYQHIQILHHPRFGHLLRIDGALQCSEADEAWYHEPLVHMVMAHAPQAQQVLIIGGGDGGAAEEALKWPQVRSLVHMELDAEVVALSRRYLRSLHHGLLEAQQQVDARYQLHIGDGLAHIAQLQAQQKTVDALVLDLTDPGGPSLPLWTAEFFAQCAQVLGPKGVLGLHIGAPWAQQARCAALLQALRSCFGTVRPFITHIAVSGGPWMMAVAIPAAQVPLPEEAALQAQLDQLQGAPLTVVDARMLQGMVALAHRW